MKTFDLGAEVRAVVAPLAVDVAEVMAMPMLMRMRLPGLQQGPYPLLPPVEELAGEVHRLRLSVADWSARRVKGEARSGLAAVMASPAHVQRPDVAEDDLKTAVWATRLVAHVEPLSAAVSAVVAAQPLVPDWCVSATDSDLSDLLAPVKQAASVLRQRIPLVRRDQLAAARIGEQAQEWATERERSRRSAALTAVGLR